MEGSGKRRESGEFEVSRSPDTATSAPRFEGANVCRVAALSTMLGGDRLAIKELAPELDELGFSDRVVGDDATWGDVDPREMFSGLSERRGDNEQDETRIDSWRAISATARGRVP